MFYKGGYFLLDYGIEDVDGTSWVCGRGLNRTHGVVDQFIDDFMASIHIRIDGKTVFSDVSNFAIVSSTRRYDETQRVCHQTSVPYANDAEVSLRLDGNIPQWMVQRLNGRSYHD